MNIHPQAYANINHDQSFIDQHRFLSMKVIFLDFLLFLVPVLGPASAASKVACCVGNRASNYVAGYACSPSPLQRRALQLLPMWLVLVQVPLERALAHDMAHFY